MQASRARSSGQLAWAVTVLGKPGSSPAQPGVETEHVEWGGGPQGPCPSRPGGWSEICGPWPAQRAPLRSACTLRAPPPAFISSQMVWLQVTETTTGYHNRTFLGGYGGPCLRGDQCPQIEGFVSLTSLDRFPGGRS